MITTKEVIWTYLILNEQLFILYSNTNMCNYHPDAELPGNISAWLGAPVPALTLMTPEVESVQEIDVSPDGGAFHYMTIQCVQASETCSFTSV